jgi:hypothetical protein
MRPVLIQKFSTPVLTDGPTKTLLVEGAENSRSVLWAMVLEVDGAITTGTTVETVEGDLRRYDMRSNFSQK